MAHQSWVSSQTRQAKCSLLSKLIRAEEEREGALATFLSKSNRPRSGLATRAHLGVLKLRQVSPTLFKLAPATGGGDESFIAALKNSVFNGTFEVY